jgi:hypothetical protein
MAKKIHKISNAYDAYWFIHNHPKFQRMMRSEVTPKEADQLEKQGFLVSRDTGGKCYRYNRHACIEAIQENLSIFYTKTNKPGGHGRVDDDKAKNKHVECWLEFGSVEYDYLYGTDGKNDWDTETGEMNYHDYRLDSGGPTFDAALIMLAKKVRKVYGDYSPRTQSDPCGPKPCADCKKIGMVMKRSKLAKKKKKG